MRASATSWIASSGKLATAQAKTGVGSSETTPRFAQLLEQATPQQATKPSQKDAQQAHGAPADDQSARAIANNDGGAAKATNQGSTATGKAIGNAAGKTGEGRDKSASPSSRGSNTEPQLTDVACLPAVQIPAHRLDPIAADQGTDEKIAASAAAWRATPTTISADSGHVAADADRNGISRDGQAANLIGSPAARGQARSAAQNRPSNQPAAAPAGPSAASPTAPSPSTDVNQAAQSIASESRPTAATHQDQAVEAMPANQTLSPSHQTPSANQSTAISQTMSPTTPADPTPSVDHTMAVSQIMSPATPANPAPSADQTVSANQTIALPIPQLSGALPDAAGATANATSQAGKPGATKTQDAGDDKGETGKAAASKIDDSKADSQSSDGKSDAIQGQPSAIPGDAFQPKPTQTADSAVSGVATNAPQVQTPAQAAAPAVAQPLQTSLPPQALQLPALAVEISARSLSGAKQFDIRLDPPELGQIDVRLFIDVSGKVKAHLSADQPQTLHLLQKDAPTLTRALRDAGLNVSQNGLNFSLRQQSGGNGAGTGQGRSKARSFTLTTNPGIEAIPVSAAYRGMVDGRLDIKV